MVAYTFWTWLNTVLRRNYHFISVKYSFYTDAKQLNDAKLKDILSPEW